MIITHASIKDKILEDLNFILHIDSPDIRVPIVIQALIKGIYIIVALALTYVVPILCPYNNLMFFEYPFRNL